MNHMIISWLIQRIEFNLPRPVVERVDKFIRILVVVTLPIASFFVTILNNYDVLVAITVSLVVLALLQTVVIISLLIDRSNENGSDFTISRDFLEELGGMSVLSHVIDNDTTNTDSTHRIKDLDLTFGISEYNAMMSIDASGIVEAEESRSFHIRIADDFPLEGRDLGIKTFHRGEEVTHSCIYETRYSKTLAVPFRSKLDHNEHFEIRVECIFNGSFDKPTDYVFVPISYFEHGVRHSSCTVFLPEEPGEAWEITLGQSDEDQIGIEREPMHVEQVDEQYMIQSKRERPEHNFAIQFERSDI